MSSSTQSNRYKRGDLGPYSKMFRTGASGTTIDGRSRSGRYLRDFEHSLSEHVAGKGGTPSIAETLLIRRAARAALRMEIYEEKMDRGEFTDHDGRVYNALQNLFLRSIATLGLKPAEARPMTHAETMAALSAAAARGQREHLDGDQ